MVLAHRPPISIPRTTVAPALLEELLGEVGSLASVYHKPSETFIGKGRIGADAVRKAGEYVFTGFLDSLAIYHFSYSLTEDQFSTQKALQTVVAGQQAENLLYVDYDVIFMEIPCRFLFSQRFRRFHELGRSAIRFGRDTGVVADACSRKPPCWDVKQPLGRPRFYFWRRRRLDATLGRAHVSFRRRRLHGYGPTHTSTWLCTSNSETQLAAATTTAR